MDPELQAKTVEFYKQALQQGASEEQAARLARRFLATLRADGGPTIGPSGPTSQPLFPTLPPMVGGALDALIAYGTGLTFGAANMIPGVSEANAEIAQRNPRTSMALKGAGAAMSVPVGIAGATAARGVGGLGLTLLRNRAMQALGAGGAGAALYQKLFGGN